MKIAYMLAVLLVAFMVGCATAPEAPPAAPPAEPATQSTPEEETPTTPAEEPVAEGEAPVEEATTVSGDVIFNGRGGFDPETIKIAAGSTLEIFVKDEGSAGYVFTAGLIRSVKVKDGEIAELAFDEAGEYTVMSIPFNKKLTVTVEEASEAEE